MNEVLNEIKSIPGIIGGFFFDAIQGIQASNLPPVFKKDNLNKIGQVLDKMYMMSKSGIDDISDIFLHYEESTIVVRRIGKTSALIVISDPSFNQNLLIMSMNMVAEKLKTISDTFDNANENNGNTHGNFHTALTNLSEKEVIADSPVSERLQGMQEGLIKIMGPMATIIFKEAVRDWIRLKDPSESTLPVLLEILSGEINDPEKEKKYLGIISPYIEDIKGIQ